MDWLQFISSIISSLAWPALLGILLFLVRSQLVGLAARLEELTFPGGKATFVKELESGRQKVEELETKSPIPAPSEQVEENDIYLRLANEMPEAGILAAFKDIENLLIQIGVGLGSKGKYSAGIMRDLVRRGFLDPPQEELYQILRAARNAVAHGTDGISKAEAVDFIEQAGYLMFILRHALNFAESKKNPAQGGA